MVKKDPLFSMFIIKMCMFEDFNFFFQVNGIDGFGGLNLFF
jgi:hypothetical protein